MGGWGVGVWYINLVLILTRRVCMGFFGSGGRGDKVELRGGLAPRLCAKFDGCLTSVLSSSPSISTRLLHQQTQMGRLQGMNGMYGLPQNPMVNVDKLHTRGLMLNKQGDYKTALDFFMQASHLAPNSPSHLISAANMLVKLEHPEPARELYERAMAHPNL